MSDQIELEKFASMMADKRQQVLSTLTQPGVVMPLLAALGAGTVGGVMSARGKPRRGETPAQRRRRVVRDALLAGVLGGGATAAGRVAVSNFGQALPAATESPVNPTARNIGRAAAGFSVGGAVGRAYSGSRNDAAREVLQQLRGSEGLQNIASPQRALNRDLERLLIKDPSVAKAMRSMTDVAGLRGNLKGPVTGQDIYNALRQQADAGGVSRSWEDKLRRVKSLKDIRGKDVHQALGTSAGRQRMLAGSERWLRRHPGLAAGAAAAVAAPAVFSALRGTARSVTPNLMTYGE